MHFQTVTPHSYKWLSYAFGLYNTFYWKRWNSNFAICMYVSLIGIYLLLFDLEYKTAVSHIVNGLGFIYFKITIVLASLPLIRLSPAVLHFPCTKWKKIEKMFLKVLKRQFLHTSKISLFLHNSSALSSHMFILTCERVLFLSLMWLCRETKIKMLRARSRHACFEHVTN